MQGHNLLSIDNNIDCGLISVLERIPEARLQDLPKDSFQGQYGSISQLINSNVYLQRCVVTMQGACTSSTLPALLGMSLLLSLMHTLQKPSIGFMPG